jgi:lysophospholipase L1-like esterase
MGGRFVACMVAAAVSLAGVGCVRQGPPPSNERYVALGDSYTSGPLIPLPVVTAQMPAGCLQSDHNYPHVVAPHLSVPLVDASCSGATTDDMTAAQDVTGTDNAPQFDRLTAQTKIVTLGIGGNDIGFADIAVACASGGLLHPDGTPCQDTYVVNGDDTISDAITAMKPKLAAVLDGIHQRSPQAKVFVVGYPAILPDTGDGCYPVMPITAGDVPYVRAKEQELNAAIQSVTAAHSDVFVDTYTPSIGHDACQAIGTKWVEPVVPTEPAAPVHPNARGEQGMATAVIAALNANGVPTT